jgi:phosphoribosylamine--glycine ligase
VVLANLRTPLGQLLMAAAVGGLDAIPPLSWQSGYAVTVVLAAAGYPIAPRTGDVITGLQEAADVTGVDIFHAGTTVNDEGDLVSAGGRVLSVTAHGDTVSSARARAYEAIDLIRLDGAHYRSDIAKAAAATVEG